MKEFIKNVLVEMHKETRTDKYGQVSRTNFSPNLFGDREDEVKQYCEKNQGILEFGTYSGSFGLFEAFTIEDSEIRIACEKALSKNENYLRNVNSW